MEITVQKLREAMSLLAPIVPKNPTLKQLSGILLENGKATANNLEISATLDIPEIEGACLVPFRAVSEMVKRIPWNETLTLEQERSCLQLSWSGGKAACETFPVEEYPGLREFEAKVEQELDGDSLMAALLAVVGYCATEDNRPVLKGVAVTLGETITLAAGDGFRMAYETLEIPFLPNGIDTIALPAGAIKVLHHLWKNTPRVAPMADSFAGLLTTKRKLETAFSDNMVRLRFGSVTMFSQLIAGTPPNFLKLLPKEGDVAIEVEAFAFELEVAIRRVHEVARAGKGIIRLEWTRDTLTVSARDGNDEAETTVKVKASGEGKVAAQAKYLLEYLKGKEGFVTMGVQSPSSPVLFRYGKAPLVLIMPMHVDWENKPQQEPPVDEKRTEPEEDPGEPEEAEAETEEA